MFRLEQALPFQRGGGADRSIREGVVGPLPLGRQPRSTQKAGSAAKLSIFSGWE